ncbi:MAG: thioredoxin domain-containing protein [Caulobacter sp.]|jgi:protein-disulfide isomerase|nr:thioredoxin domain-containing protein [Caulobacter sp.]
MGKFDRRAFFGMTAVVATAVASLALAGCGPKGAAVEGDMSLGNPDAKVKIIEYASLSCIHCANWNKDVFPAFKKKYIDTGKVQYTFRPFQLGPQDTYTAASDLLGRCVGKDKYFTVIDALFHSQEEALTGGPRDVLLRVARTAGLSEEQVSTCLGDEKAVLAQAERFTTGLAKEVSATPTFFINDQKLESEVPLAQIDKAYEAAMAKAK